MRAGLLILSGFNVRAVVALCRWAASASVPAHLVARDNDDPIYLTDYRAQIFEKRISARLELADLIAWIARLRAEHNYSQVLIAPSTEFLNRLLVKHRAPIEAAGGIVPLVDEKLYAQISDKHAFESLCATHGLPVPVTFASTPDQLPFVAKPKTYGVSKCGQIKPYLVCTPEDLEDFRAREDVSNYTLQEFVEGQSLYLLAHLSRTGVVTACAQENLIQQARGGSIVLARSHDFHRHPDAHRYVQMLRAVGFHGLVMIEVRRCTRTGRHVMIEANPRMWGPLQFTLDQRVDLLGAWLADYGFAPKPAPRIPAARPYYFWSGGLNRHAAPFAYHNFSADHFVEDYAAIAASDLFDRNDTFRLHAHERSPASAHEYAHAA